MTAPASSHLLAIDTSSDVLAVALGAGPQVFALNLPGGPAASGALLPAVAQLLGQARLAVADLDAVAYGRGPGAFTGLRTSCAVAQGLALGLDCPALPIDSLLIVAEDARAGLEPRAGGRQLDIGVAVDARMGEIYAARYAWLGGHWQTLEPPALCAPAELIERWRVAPPSCLAGSGVALLPVDALPSAIRVAGERDRAAALLALTRTAWACGEGVDAAQALPLYLRNKVALTTEERVAARTVAAPVGRATR